MKIWYAVQSTGFGHLAPYRTLAGTLVSMQHEVITMTSGPELPSFFKPVGLKHYHFQGPTLVINGEHLDLARTIGFNMLHFPQFISHLLKVRKLIREEKPDLVIVDYEPFTSTYLRLWKPNCPSFTVDHQSTFLSPVFPLPDIKPILKIITKIFSHAKIHLCSSFLDYGSSGSYVCIPPILRPEVMDLKSSDDGSVVVYHSSASSVDKEYLKKTCPKDRRFIFYGYEPGIYGNLEFRSKGDSFLDALSKCHLYVTHCGYFSVCEALVLGKKVICQPFLGHPEQELNARILEIFENVRIVKHVNYADLRIDELKPPDPRKTLWLRDGLRLALKHILNGNSVRNVI